MKKAISPLISWILLIGMVVAMGTMVSVYLINQAEKTGERIKISQYEELYCPDVAFDGQKLCYLEEFANNNFKLNLTIKNRGTFSIYNITFNTVPIGILGDYIMEPPEKIPLFPKEEVNLLFVADLGNIIIDSDDSYDSDGIRNEIVEHDLQELTISPEINIEGEEIVCNQKIFKLETSNYDIPIC